MLDLELGNDEKSTGIDDNADEVILDEAASETIEIPQEVIDDISDNDTSDESEESNEASAESEDLNDEENFHNS